MKFDLVLGNPPYQDSSHTEKKNTLWRKFVEQAHQKWVKPKGVVAQIIPSSWVGSQQLLIKYFLPHDVVVINKDECRRHFPGVGSSFSYYVLVNQPYNNKTLVINQEIDGTVVREYINLNDVLCGAIPRNMSTDSVSIIKKVLHSNRPLIGITNACTHHNVKREHWRTQKGERFIFPVQNTPTSVYYYDYPHPDQDRIKIAIPTSTYYRNMIITSNGVTQGMCYFNVPDDVDPDIALHNMKNKVFDYINECFRYANWNSVPLLRSLPSIPFDKKMTNENMYQHFNLTSTEISLIERTIK